ncbi:MAG: bifunctional metallophosphatase/5'-nucleotidase [Thiobacillus sp.]
MKRITPRKAIFAVATIACCGIGQAFAATPADVKLTFIEISDLHANLVSHKELIHKADGATTVARRGGMARMKTLIQGVKQSNPNTIVMNIGDTFHGGVEAFYTLGNAVADPLNALGIDVGVAGNWDFYFTPAITRLRYGRVTGMEQDRIERSMPAFAEFFPIKRPNFPNLGANVKDISDFITPQNFFAPTHLLTYNGVKVGFIGFTSDIVEQMHPLLAEGMDFAYGIEEHKNLIIKHARELRAQGADIVVLMSELGIHKDIALSKALAAMRAKGTLEAGLLDMVFSAHTHELTRTMVTTAADGSALYAPVVEPGADSNLGRLDVTMKYKDSTTTRERLRITTEQNWTVASKQWRILPVDESVAEDPTVKTLVAAARKSFLKPTDGSAFKTLHALPFLFQTLKEPIDTVIGHIDSGNVAHQNDMMSGVINRKNSGDSTFNDAFTHMLLDVSNSAKNNIPHAKVAMSPGFRMGATLPEAGFLMENNAIATGNITLEDAYRFFPMYYGAATAQTTGADLKRRVEDSLKHTYSSDAFNHGGGWATGFAGIKQTINLANGDPRGMYVPGSTPDTFTSDQLSRVLALHFESGEEVQDNEVLTVIGCSRLPMDYKGTICGQPGYTNVQRVIDNMDGTLSVGEINTTVIAIGPRPATMIDLFVNNLKAGYKLKTSGVVLQDLSQFPMFPGASYMQPLEGTGGYIQTAPSEDPCGYFKWKCLPGQPL